LLDLVEKIFVYEPNQRITPEEAMKHPYFSDFKETHQFKNVCSKGQRKQSRQIKEIKIEEGEEFS